MKKKYWDFYIGLLLFIVSSFLDLPTLIKQLCLIFSLFLFTYTVRHMEKLNKLTKAIVYIFGFCIYFLFSIIIPVWLVLHTENEQFGNFWLAYYCCFMLLVHYGIVKYCDNWLSILSTILIYFFSGGLTFGSFLNEELEIMPITLGLVIAGLTIIDKYVELFEE